MAVSGAAEWILRETERILAARAAAVEQACEAALQGGQHGVAVVTDGSSLYVGVSAVVPYGMRWEFPSITAYANSLAHAITADLGASDPGDGLEPPGR